MARRRDLDIVWVVLLAAACWGALWEHEPISAWKRSWINFEKDGQKLLNKIRASGSEEFITNI